MLSVRRMAWWPGLPNLWYRGEIYSLAVSILYATILDIALLATLVWPEWLDTWFVRSLWGLLAIASLWSFAVSFFSTSTIRSAIPTDECNRLLAVAQRDYLRGEYLEAEASLHRILSAGHEDVEAALLLASVLRRTGRKRQAIDCLDRLERLESSNRWTVEIDDERRKCESSDSEGARGN